MANSNNDIVRTFIISHRNQADEAKKFKVAFRRVHEVELKTKNDLLPGPNLENAEENTGILLERFSSVAGVLFIYSQDLVNLLNQPESQQTQVDIQVSGEDVPINAKLLTYALQQVPVYKKKVILIQQPRYTDVSIPKCLAGKAAVRLPSSSEIIRADKRRTIHEIWIRDTIVPQFRQNQRLFHQNSIGDE